MIQPRMKWRRYFKLWRSWLWIMIKSHRRSRLKMQKMKTWVRSVRRNWWVPYSGVFTLQAISMYSFIYLVGVTESGIVTNYGLHISRWSVSINKNNFILQCLGEDAIIHTRCYSLAWKSTSLFDTRTQELQYNNSIIFTLLTRLLWTTYSLNWSRCARWALISASVWWRWWSVWSGIWPKLVP